MTQPHSFLDLQRQLARHLRDPQGHALPTGLDPRRVGVYRELVFNNVSTFVNNSFPVARAILGAVWPRLVAEFFASHRCDSPVFIDIPAEFLAFITSHYPQGVDDKPFIPELLHYEWMELVVAIRDETPLTPLAGEDNDPTLVVQGAAAPLLYRFPVHQISRDVQPLAPPAEPTGLLIYRDGDDQVRFMAMAPLLIGALQLLAGSEGMTLPQWGAALAAQYPEWPEEVLANGLRLSLAELAARRIVGQRVASDEQAR